MGYTHLPVYSLISSWYSTTWALRIHIYYYCRGFYLVSLDYAENSKYQAGIYWNWNPVAGAVCLPQRKTTTSSSFLGQHVLSSLMQNLLWGSSRNWKCFNWQLTTQCRMWQWLGSFAQLLNFWSSFWHVKVEKKNSFFQEQVFFCRFFWFCCVICCQFADGQLLRQN